VCPAGGATLASLIRTGDASLVLVVAGSEVRVLPIDRSWIAAASTIEIQIPFDRLGVTRGSDLSFAVQLRDRSGSILEGRSTRPFLDDCGS
jgi:hypothetical protein